MIVNSQCFVFGIACGALYYINGLAKTKLKYVRNAFTCTSLYVNVRSILYVCAYCRLLRQ